MADPELRALEAANHALAECVNRNADALAHIAALADDGDIVRTAIAALLTTDDGTRLLRHTLAES